jgi:hypothetical protein
LTWPKVLTAPGGPGAPVHKTENSPNRARLKLQGCCACRKFFRPAARCLRSSSAGSHGLPVPLMGKA